MFVRCEYLQDGPGPSEAIVRIRTADGSVEEVVVSRKLIVDDSISVGSALMKDGGNVLVELPRETVTGRWRVWVPAGDTGSREPVLAA